MPQVADRVTVKQRNGGEGNGLAWYQNGCISTLIDAVEDYSYHIVNDKNVAAFNLCHVTLGGGTPHREEDARNGGSNIS